MDYKLEVFTNKSSMLFLLKLQDFRKQGTLYSWIFGQYGVSIPRS